MADNCFQVWHCSVNEFVLFRRQLTVSFLPFISLSFFTHIGILFDFLLFVFVFLLSGLHIYPLLGSFNALSFTFSLNLSPSLFSQYHILWRGGFLHLCFTCSLCLVCLLGANNRKVFYFAVNYSQQIVYLDFSSLILLYSSITFIRAPQQLKTPTNTDELCSEPLSMLKFSSD